MKFAKKYFYVATIILVAVGGALYLFSDSIFSMPTDFQTTSDQRAEFYPRSYTLSESFTTSWELYSEDYWYVYFTESTSHSCSVKIDLVKNGASYVDVVIKSFYHDSNGLYSVYDLTFTVQSLQGSTLGSASGITTLTVPEREGYKFVLSGTYYYIACTSSDCWGYDVYTKTISETITLDFDSMVWSENQESLGNLMPTIAFSVVIVIFAVEYGVNFTSRNKKFKIINGVSAGAAVGVFIYGMVGIGLATGGDYFTNYRAPIWLMIGSIVAHLATALIEENTTKSASRPSTSYQPATYSQPIYQPSSYTQSTVQQPTTDTSEPFVPKFCTSCGGKIESDSKFCTNCGADVN
ncbi:MAG: zinc-ribbon domain-containing protein [Candidatus Heimdallarchaeota archaeon]|nr:zinc-ribbon domain-containing protein [Candidatus Heimdallarchaeota archaeon]